MQRRAFVRDSVLMAAAVAVAGDLSAAPSSPDAPLYLLSYDHGGLILWGIPHFKQSLAQAAAWLDLYPWFKLGLDNEAYTYDHLAEHDPATLEEIRAMLVRYRGRFAIGTSTYGQPLSTFINEESNLRQLSYAVATIERHFHTRPVVYLMSEHAMHAQMPQLLAATGFRGAVLRTHYQMYGFNPTFPVPVGWWTGLDGTRLWALPTYPGEGASYGRTTEDNWILTRCPGPDCRGLSLDQFASQFAAYAPLVASRVDDANLKREDLVAATGDRRRYGWVLAEELAQVLPPPSATMATAPDDFQVRMPWGYCGNWIWNECRLAERTVLEAERLAALAALADGAPAPSLDAAWRPLLVAQHHDVQIVGLFPEAHRFLEASLDAAAAVRTDALARVTSHLRADETGQVQINVFNSQSWSRREWVTATLDLPRHWAKRLRVASGGVEVQSAIVSALRASDESLQQVTLALRPEVPGLGVLALHVEPAASPSHHGDGAMPTGIAYDAAARVLSTDFWRIRLADRGGIESLVERNSGRELFAPDRRSAFFAGTINGVAAESQGAWHLLPGPMDSPWRTLRERGAIGGIPYQADLTVWAGSPRLDYEIEFEFEEQKIGLLSDDKRDSHSPFIHDQKLRFKLFPAVGQNALGVRDLPFAVATTTDAVVQGLYWTAVAGEGVGCAVFNRGTMGSVRESDGGFSVPLAYAMYYIWGTRLLSGRYRYELALLPFVGPWEQSDLHRQALAYNFPLVASAGSAGDGRLGARFAPVRVIGEGAVASALLQREGRIEVRLFEYRGQPARITLQSETPAKKSIAVRLRPWEVRTVKI